MKEPDPPFRLYDFLAYLFPGAATLHAIYLLMNGEKLKIIGYLSTGYETVDFIYWLIAAYVIGLAWSVMSRDLVRTLIWKYDNPRFDYYEGQKVVDSPFGEDLSKALKDKIMKQFGDNDLKAEQAHRLCRAYVAQNCPSSWDRRKEILAVRSMCANFIGPAILYAVAFFSAGWKLFGVMALVGAAALMMKTITLDRREWKEIYVSFLTHQYTRTKERIPQNKNETSDE
jgi:hypothetical protein